MGLKSRRFKLSESKARNNQYMVQREALISPGKKRWKRKSSKDSFKERGSPTSTWSEGARGNKTVLRQEARKIWGNCSGLLDHVLFFYLQQLWDGHKDGFSSLLSTLMLIMKSAKHFNATCQVYVWRTVDFMMFHAAPQAESEEMIER